MEANSSEGQDVHVSFAKWGKGFGVFKWPCGDDVGIVSRRSVLEINVPYEARGSGRSWFVKNAQEIQEKFQNM